MKNLQKFSTILNYHLILYLLVNLFFCAPSFSFVVCFHESGFIEIEPGLNGSCQDSHLPDTEEEHSGSCTDFQLSYISDEFVNRLKFMNYVKFCVDHIRLVIFQNTNFSLNLNIAAYVHDLFDHPATYSCIVKFVKLAILRI